MGGDFQQCFERVKGRTAQTLRTANTKALPQGHVRHNQGATETPLWQARHEGAESKCPLKLLWLCSQQTEELLENWSTGVSL